MDGLDILDSWDMALEGVTPIHSADGSHGCRDGGGVCTCQSPHGQPIQDITIGTHIMEQGIDTLMGHIKR